MPAVTGKLNFVRKQQKLGFLDDKPVVWGIQMLRGGVIDHDDIVAYAAKAANAPANDVNTALDALLDAITYFVINGHTVQIPGLGSLGTITKVKVAQTLEEAGTDNIKNTHIQFYPNQQMRQLCSLANVNCRLVELEDGKDLTPGGDDDPEPEP
mgnify:CR=1 FL=1